VGFFSDLVVRSNGDDVDASWWNTIRTAGLNLEAGSGTWTKFTVAFGALTDAGTTVNIQLVSLLAKQMIDRIVVKHSTAFSGGSVSALTLSVGIAGDLTRFTTPFDVFQAVGNTVFQATGVEAEPEDFGSATSIRLSAIATGDNLDQLAAGSVDIWVKTSLLP